MNKNNTIDLAFLTFIMGKACKYCDKPIADHEHASRIFCPKIILPDGTIQNCKDDFWAEIRKNESDIYKIIAIYQKKASTILGYIYELNLPEISFEIIDSTGIHLNKCLYRSSEENYMMTFYFVDYSVTIHSKTNLIKIIQHDQELLKQELY
jgi:hypothetical protein